MRTRPVCPVPRAHERRARECAPGCRGKGEKQKKEDRPAEEEESARTPAGGARTCRRDARQWRNARCPRQTNTQTPEYRSCGGKCGLPSLQPATSSMKMKSPLRSSSPRGAEAMRESEKDRDASEGAPTSPLHRFEGRTRRRCLFFFKFEIKRPNVPQCGDWRQLLSTPNFCVFQLHAHLLTPELTSPDRRVDSAGAGFRAFVRRASC